MAEMFRQFRETNQARLGSSSPQTAVAFDTANPAAITQMLKDPAYTAAVKAEVNIERERMERLELARRADQESEIEARKRRSDLWIQSRFGASSSPSPSSHASASPSSRPRPNREEAAPPPVRRPAYLSQENDKIRTKLICDINNLIFALGFRQGPAARERVSNFSLLFLALLLPPEKQAWQKIEVDRKGPKNPGMHAVLEAAITALTELDPEILITAKAAHDGEYDLVQPKMGREKSLSSGGYTHIAEFFGTITNQPGMLVRNILLRADAALEKFLGKHAVRHRTLSQ